MNDRLLVVPLMAIGLVVSLQAVQQPAPKPPPGARHSPYEQLLDRYAAGDFDEIASAIASQPADTFEKPLREAQAHAIDRIQWQLWALRSAQLKNSIYVDQARDDLLRMLLTAMVVHVDAALRARDDQVNAQMEVAAIAGRAFDEVTRTVARVQPDRRLLSQNDAARLMHDWMVLVVGARHARSHLEGVPEFVATGLERYPDDPALELGLGVYLERAAANTVVDTSLVKDIYVAAAVGQWRDVLATAERWLRGAVADPALAPEAHLRIGRIHQLLGEPKRAREELQPLLERQPPVDPAIRYLALLNLASLDEADKAADRADARYQEALTLFPSAQAPMLALSHLRDDAGDAQGAHDWLNRSFGSAHLERRLDPWWGYGGGPFWDVVGMVDRLRPELRR